MDPYAPEEQANTKDMTARLPQRIDRPQLGTNSIKFNEIKCG
jgi:hypothetical protein